MNMKAQDTMKKLSARFTPSSKSGFFYALDNTLAIESLNDEAVHVQDINGFETWTMGDGSFIARDEDVYWTGDDITSYSK